MPGVRVVDGRPADDALRRTAGGGSCRRSSSALGVLRHLLRHGRDYDLVLTGSFPYFGLLAAALVRRAAAASTSSSTGPRCGRASTGASTSAARRPRLGVQRRCIRVRQQALCPSELHARRLRDGGLRGDGDGATGASTTGRCTTPAPLEAEPVVVFAGRHIPEKRVTAVVPAVALAREAIPGAARRDLRRRPRSARAVLRQIAECGLGGVVEAPGLRRPRSARARRSRARSACCCRRAARATG